MAKRAETLWKPRRGWGRASRVAQGSVLAISMIAGASILQADPLEADASRTNQLAPIASRQETATNLSERTTSGPGLSMSVSAFSAAQSDTARVLLAQELGGESNRAVGARSFPTSPEPQAGTRRGEAEARQADAAVDQVEEEKAIVGRSLRAFTRDQEEVDTTSPRRRATFSSAISRAAAAGALTSTNPNASLSNALSSSRFTPPSNAGQFDPGFSKAAEVLSVVPGLQLQSATIFGGYSSNSLPRGFSSGGSSYFNGTQLGADYDLGASAVISYSHTGRRSLTLLNYTPSHVQRSRIPDWSSTDHRLSFQTSRDLTPRLSWRTSANAGNSGMEQFWTRPAVIRRVEAPASFNELMERVLAGEISDDEFAAILTGSPVVDDPGGSEYELSRVLSMSASTGASYAYSRRLTLNFSGTTAANRLLGGGLEERARGSRYIDFARTSSANVAANYRLSSRTRVSLSHATTFTNSSYIRSTSQSPTVSLNQTLSRHWSYDVGAGIGAIQFDESSNTPLLSTTTWTARGSLGYTAGAHQVSLSGSKQVGDPMGFGSRSTMQANLTWGWQPRFSPWGANAGIAFSRSDIATGSQFGRNFASDLYSAGLSRRLTPSTMFRTDYFFGEFISPYSGVASNMSLHRVQMSLVWRPAER